MSNPLLQKYGELKNPKKEEPKPIPSFKTYDPHSVEDTFFQVAELIRKDKAKVISTSIEFDNTGRLGLQTITFQVQVWDT